MFFVLINALESQSTQEIGATPQTILTSANNSLPSSPSQDSAYTREYLDFLPLFWASLQSNLQLQLIVALFFCILLCCCCCSCGFIGYCGWRHGIWKRLMALFCGTMNLGRRQKGRVSSKKGRRYENTRESRGWIRKLLIPDSMPFSASGVWNRHRSYKLKGFKKIKQFWRDEEDCFLVLDDEDAFDWASRKGLLPLKIGDAVACYRGYIQQKKDRFYFCLDPPQQRWKFVTKRDSWKKMSKKKRIELDCEKLCIKHEDYCQWIEAEPYGQVLNSSRLTEEEEV